MTPRRLLTPITLCLLAWAPVASPANAQSPAASQPQARAEAPASATLAASGAEAEQQGIEPVDYNPDDPEMRKAAKQARATLPRFFRATSAPGAQVNSVGVRVLLREGKQGEFVWVMPFAPTDQGKNTRFEGTVNDIPRKIKQVVTGQKISFQREDIVDWMYIDTRTNQLKGHFTTCVLLRKAPAEERAQLKQSYGLDCGR